MAITVIKIIKSNVQNFQKLRKKSTNSDKPLSRQRLTPEKILRITIVHNSSMNCLKVLEIKKHINRTTKSNSRPLLSKENSRKWTTRKGQRIYGSP